MKKQGKYEKRANGYLLKTFLTSQLCLLLCVAMFLGTTYAWFTSEVVSEGNEINIGTLDVDLYKQTETGPLDLSVNKLFDSEARWEPGYTALETVTVENKGNLSFRYELTFTNGKVLVNGAEDQTALSEIAKLFTVYVHAGDYAAGEEKPTCFADIQKIAEDEDTLETEKPWRVVRLGNKPATLADILERGLPVFSGNMEADDGKDTYIIALHMIGNEEITEPSQQAALNAAMGKTISLDVKLNAYQRTHEQDAFGAGYDLKAHVTNLGALTVNYKRFENFGNTPSNETIDLDATYQFQPVESAEEGQASPYRKYIADFVISADADVLANSIALAGYYDLFCELANGGDWIVLEMNSTDTIQAGTEIRLVGSMGEGLDITYEMLCNFGNDGIGFMCGLKNKSDTNIGKTITVELRLYETKLNEEGHYVIADESAYIVAGRETYVIQ